MEEQELLILQLNKTQQIPFGLIYQRFDFVHLFGFNFIYKLNIKRNFFKNLLFYTSLIEER